MVTIKDKTPPRRSSALPWVITGVAAASIVAVMATGGRRGKPSHPEPRPRAASLGESVMPAGFFADNPRAQRTYQMARQIPGMLDAVYCNCHCKEELGHRSLLTCFQSQHGSGCDVCLGEAELVYRLQTQGRNLKEIRQQIDLAFQR